MEDRERNLYECLTEDFVEPAANFYIDSENRERFYALWEQFKRILADYTHQPSKESERILVYLNSVLKRNPKISLAQAIDLINASKPASYTYQAKGQLFRAR